MCIQSKFQRQNEGEVQDEGRVRVGAKCKVRSLFSIKFRIRLGVMVGVSVTFKLRVRVHSGREFC